VGLSGCGRGNVGMRTGECEYAGGGMWVGYVLKYSFWVQRYEKGRNTRREKFFARQKE
jgi:hypothetical protein